MRVVHIHINLLRASQAILGYDIFGEWMYVTADGDVTSSALKAYKSRISLELRQCHHQYLTPSRGYFKITRHAFIFYLDQLPGCGL